ncbi:MAG: bile acid:sodium symporter [Planctomycetes bacterium]|nr:bile acid:sodium symporter [Planctomycetota bacterium]
MIAFLRYRWFLLTLLAVLTAGMTWPNAMQPIRAWLPSNAIMAIVTFIMALPLETHALWSAVRRPGPAWLAVGMNSGLAPLLGWLASRTLPSELALGVIVATVVPCTLATAAVWTRRAGGNDAVAFLVTMVTNLACFIVVPAWLKLLAGLDADVDYRAIVIGLILWVVLPIIVAQMLRQWRPIGQWGTRHKLLLSGLAQFGVLSMVFIGAVGCGQRLQAVSDHAVLSFQNVVVMIVGVAVVHVTLLVLGMVAGRRLRMAREDAIAVAFAGSQKTLMVGAFLALSVGPLAILPMVTYHAVQLFVDTLIADWLRGKPAAATNR